MTVEWTGLPEEKIVNDALVPIAYTVVEVGVNNGKITMNGAEYTVNVSGTAENGFTTRSNSNDSNHTVNTLTYTGMSTSGIIDNTDVSTLLAGNTTNYVSEGNDRYYYKDIKAVYGADISSQWPKYSDHKDVHSGNTTYTFVSWYMMNNAASYNGQGSGLDTIKGLISIMDEKLLGDVTKKTGRLSWAPGSCRWSSLS